MKLEKSDLFGTLTLTGSALLVKVLGFIYKIPLSSFLGDEGMGYYNSALTVYAIFYILSSSAIPKAYSTILTRARINNTRKAYLTSIFVFSSLFLIIASIFSVTLYYFSREIARLVGIIDSVYAIRMVAPAVFFSFLSALCRGYLLSIKKLVSVAISEAIEAFMKLFCGVFVIIKTKNLGLSLIQVSAYATLGVTIGAFFSFFFLFIIIIVAKKEKYTFGIAPFSFSRFISSTLKITVPLTLTSVLLAVSNILDMTLINKGLLATNMPKEIAISQYGNYTTLVLPLFSFVSSLASAFSLSIFPKLTQAYEERKLHELKSIVEMKFSILFSFSIFVGLGFYFFGEDYFSMIFPNNNILQGTVLLKIMSPAVLFIALSTLLNTVLEAGGYTFAPLATLGISTIIKIPFSYLAIKKFGIEGSAFATVFTYGITFLLSYALVVKRYKVNIFKLRDLIKSSFVCLISFTIGLFMKTLFKHITSAAYFRILPILICTGVFIVVLQLLTKRKRIVSENLTF